MLNVIDFKRAERDACGLKSDYELSQKKQESEKEKVVHVPQVEFKSGSFFSNIRRRSLKIEEQTIE